MKKVSDIIKHALEVIDAADSNVISYKEMNDYLETAWKEVNQKMINKGLKYFYKKVGVLNGMNELPWDFYQIDCIRRPNGWMVPLKTNDMSDREPSYQILGNYLEINGVYDGLELCYYAKPITLTYPNKKQKVDEELASPINHIGNPITEDNGVYYEHNLRTGESKAIFDNTESNRFITNVINGKQIGFTYSVTENDTDTFYSFIVNHNGTVLVQPKEGWLYLDENNNVGIARSSIVNHQMTVDFWNRSEAFTVSVESITDNVVKSGSLYTNIDGKIWNITDNIDTGISSDYYVPTTFEDCPALLTPSKIIWEKDGEYWNENTDATEAVMCILKADPETGYGYLTSDGTDNFIESYMPDTALDFPNTVLYDYLSYLVGYYISLKIGADISWIEQAATQSETLLLDSIDSNGSYPTLIDVYDDYRLF